MNEANKNNDKLREIIGNLDFSVRTHNCLLRIMNNDLQACPEDEDAFKDEIKHLDIIRVKSSFYMRSDLHQAYSNDWHRSNGIIQDGKFYFNAKNFGKLSFIEFVKKMHDNQIPLSEITEETYSNIKVQTNEFKEAWIPLSKIKRLFDLCISPYPYMFNTNGKAQLKLFMDQIEQLAEERSEDQ